ncbi:bifunctional PIG-L family deacetylase/class I SAM-dependent methyltransferase [Gulosibacter chungangensis]|uniref:Methyltransferase domain-containing protein n=1 Tax=Gulosibacter chungangensis TaxID=979746 RepID=A0A7J5B7P9_9MICO|nr:bifunctional PIG-L family deacetylase/class I SAM-dependent methyltransferase [Gulosibacter chungangensis]KAB1640846.1 methyltransferase domain-containing protein [Gulosibacter chungangensis]
MTTFSHRDLGTDPKAWARVRKQLPMSLTEILPEGADLVVLAAHPDDEVLGAGGLIASAAERGHATTVMLCSDGEASHPDSPTHTPNQLASIRRAEFERALETLRGDEDAVEIRGVALGLPDGRLASFKDTIEAALDRVITDRTTIVAPFRADNHPDHEAVGKFAAAVAAQHELLLLEYPIWYWHWATPESDTKWQTMLPLPLDDQAMSAKQAAIRAYPSQFEALSPAIEDAAVLSERFLEHFSFDVEVFRLSNPGLGSGARAEETFDALFKTVPEPWDFNDDYERRKRAILLASLPKARYQNALELGSATGALTAELAERCDRVVGVDASETAVRDARKRLAGLENVKLVPCVIPRESPDVRAADLVVMSEIGYFLTRNELEETFAQIEATIGPDSDVLLCHWLHPINGWSLMGEDVHEAAHARGWKPRVTHREPDFLLEIFSVPVEGQS